MKVNVLPTEDNTNGWSKIIPKREPKPSLKLNQRFDWVIIGAGYAGLAAARRLAEINPQLNIALVEAVEVGETAAGRNSGFAIDVPHNVGSSMAELQKAAHYKVLMKAGIASLKSIIKKHNIQCDWQVRGKYHCAVSADISNSTLQHHMHELDRIDEPYEYLEDQQLSDRIGTQYFHSGIYTPGCILLNPAALTKGLADCLPKNVTLYEYSPIISIEYGKKIQVQSHAGSICADQVILTNNALIKHFGFGQRQIFPLVSFATLSKPLNAEQRARLGGEDNWGITPANALTGATMRFTQDQRLLVRQDFCYTPNFKTSTAMRDNAMIRHKEVFNSRFPMLGDVEMEHFWSGTLGITANGAPIWGQLAQNVYAAAGCNGVGIAKQSIAGELIADLALKQDQPLIADMQALGTASKMVPRPFLDLGIYGYLAKERWVGRKEY